MNWEIIPYFIPAKENYLAENGWVASTGPMGNMAQAEWAVSFDWLGVTNTAQRFVEIPRLLIFSARMRLSPEDKKALLALPLEERKSTSLVRYSITC